MSDPTRTIASPHSVIETRSERSERRSAPANRGEPIQPPDRLVALVREMSPEAVVLGIPIQMDGGEGEMAKEVREFGRRLAEATGARVVEWDERLTSARARRSLAEAGRRGRRAPKGREDMVAAAHLLRAYMDSLA